MVTLKKITRENFNKCVQLSVSEEQRSFVAGNLYSLAQAYVAKENGYCTPFPFAVYDGITMVGFVMIAYDPPERYGKSEYEIWRLMIDSAYQGRGLGRQAMEAALSFIRTLPCGGAERVSLSYEPENTVAKALYASFGFTETGEIEDGEVVAVLPMEKLFE